MFSVHANTQSLYENVLKKLHAFSNSVDNGPGGLTEGTKLDYRDTSRLASA